MIPTVSALDDVLTKVLGVEGGVADVGDGAGTTYYGQTQAWLDTWTLPIPMNQAEARENYRQWARRTRLANLVGDTFDVFGWAMVDWAVNSGESVPIKALQRRLVVPADGVLGPQTLAAVAADDRHALAREIVADHVRYYMTLEETDPQRNTKFAESWGNRIAQQVEVL